MFSYGLWSTCNFSVPENPILILGHKTLTFIFILTDDNEGNNDGISGRESVDYSYNDYYYSPSPLRRLGQTDDYYYYYADEYYPYIEARNERQQTGKLSKMQNFHFFIH